MNTEKENDTICVYLVLIFLQLYALCGVIEEVNLINVVYFIVVNHGAIRFYINK
jgi:hypothetical protein